MSIQFIYFDLGNVLFKVDHSKAWDQTITHCQGELMPLMERFYSWGSIIEHMIGNLTDDAFFQQMKDLLEFEGTESQLKSYWETAFQLLPDRWEQVKTLSHRFGLGALSNISAVHSKYLERTVPSMQRLSHRFYSWEVGFVKPRVEIFDKAQTHCGKEPGEILFIDDQQQHVDKAKSLGWHAIQVSLDQDMLQEVEHYLEQVEGS